MYLYRGLFTYHTSYTLIENAKKSICLFNAGPCPLMCIDSLILKKYRVVA